MNRLYLTLTLFFCTLLAGCSSTRSTGPALSMIEVTDRNDFRETLSSEDRLKTFEKVNFSEPQPYKKVVRVFKRDTKGIPSKLTTYHENGTLWQYLEVLSGRARGVFKEWYPNGQLKIQATVIEGIGDLNEEAMKSWIFEGQSLAYHENGKLQALFHYSRGKLEKEATYYHTNGERSQVIPYYNNHIHGRTEMFNEEGQLLGFTYYNQGQKDGESVFYGSKKQPKLSEFYEKNKLMKGCYYNLEHQEISRVDDGHGFISIFDKGRLQQQVEIQNGFREGLVKDFYSSGRLKAQYTVKNGDKHGDEWVYYDNNENSCLLFMHYNEGDVHGMVKTWYENGSLESQKQMSANKKEGLHTAWYKDGSKMLVEQYQDDKLLSGKYYRKGLKDPFSKVDNGFGTATLYDAEGRFLKKVSYANQEIVD